MVSSPLTFTRDDDASVEWAVSADLIDYDEATTAMEARVAAIREGSARELVWLLEHPPLYTAGTSAKPEQLKDARFPVYKSPRGGQFTYHGPGQRVAYVMLDLSRRQKDVRAFVASLEEWIIATLKAFNVDGERRSGRVGVWVDRARPGGARHEDKIAAIGVRLRHWISFHGISLNVEPTLEDFEGIVPCGIEEPGLGVTSLVDLGLPVTMSEADAAMHAAWASIFGPAKFAAPPI